MNPYLIQGPAIISFSGGRTSAYMLKQIIDAHGGKLPDNVVVAFANTGKEREETLRFVHECESRWNVPIHWVEWRATPRRATGTASLAAWLATNDPEGRLVNPAGFERVGFNSASRQGEPFAALIAMKQRLPNWQERWCTEFLKVNVLTALAESLGWAPGSYAEVIGLRHDEGRRILKAYENANFKWDRKTKAQVRRVPPRRVLHPLATAKVVKADVMGFWLGLNSDPANPTLLLPQGFDLGLRDYEGNCDLCFMKGKKIRKRLIREKPRLAPWWNKIEIGRNQFFDRRDRVAGLILEVMMTPDLFDEVDEDEDYDAECGLHCAPAEAFQGDAP